MKTLELKTKCKSCKGTGLYIGMAERHGAAVVCSTCEGTGCHTVRFEYEDFVKKEQAKTVKRVYKTNPGFVIGVNESIGLCLADFGGMSFEDYSAGKEFPPKSEMRKHTCPAWWYQSADWELKPDWDECGFGTFSKCDNFPNKNKCWERFDSENKQAK